MIKAIRNVCSVAMCAVALVSTASAADDGYSGVVCNPSTFSDVSKLAYGQFGVHNTAASTAVACGANPIFGADVNRIEAIVYDRNAATDVCCTMMVLDADGLVLSSSTPCSAGSGAASQLLLFIPAFNVSSTVAMTCSIPAVSGGQLSHVTTYRVRTTI
jgi:hypothetical protein